jgi:hypothetical protein
MEETETKPEIKLKPKTLIKPKYEEDINKQQTKKMKSISSTNYMYLKSLTVGL